MLSNKSINELSKAIAPSVVDYVFSSQEYCDFMYEVIEKCLRETMGHLHEELLQELVCGIFDRIYLKND